MSVDRILLTNDDGIEAVGLHALHEALADDYEVTTVAPAEDRSSVGRSLSSEVDVHAHDLGYAVDGTPSDCVVAGLGTLAPDADVVVAGCNEGANLGEYTLGRSGTVSAAVEATFFGVPAIAASMYVPGGDDWWKRDLDHEEFAHAARATRFLVDRAVDAGTFDAVDYVNLNAPIADGDPAPIRLTRPSTWHELDAERTADGVTFHDGIWDRMFEGNVPDPVGTDRRAILDGEVSVSPLSATHAVATDELLERLVDEYVATS